MHIYNTQYQSRKKSIEIKRLNKFTSVQFDNTSRKGDYIRSAFKYMGQFPRKLPHGKNVIKMHRV